MLDNLRWSDLASLAFKAGENVDKPIAKLAEKNNIFENFENLFFFNFLVKFQTKINAKALIK